METQTQKNPIQAKRQKLKNLSEIAETKYKEASAEEVNRIPEPHTVNRMLAYFIYKLGDERLKTYKGWQNAGRQVKRGEKALLFWGRPVNLNETDPKYIQKSEKLTQDELKKAFFPLSFLFAESQTDVKP